MTTLSGGADRTLFSAVSASVSSTSSSALSSASAMVASPQNSHATRAQHAISSAEPTPQSNHNSSRR
eukprot:m.38148 g.38148  ORF g.38148 m.38148 type:complete len:67 (+) comp11614_c0_seq1:711-911(+)